MKDQSNQSQKTTLPDTNNAISSLELGAGPSPSKWPVGPSTGLCGPEVVHVSRSPLPEIETRTQLRINATFGPNSTDLFQGARLQSFLENRLRRRLGDSGSLEYSLTWKHWDIAGQQPICALRASVRRISDKDCIGWPTPQVFDSTNGGVPRPLRFKGSAPSEQGSNRNPLVAGSYRGELKDWVGAVWGCPTPTVSNVWDGQPWEKYLLEMKKRRAAVKERGLNGSGRSMTLTMAVQSVEIGIPPKSFDAKMEKTGVLNHQFVRWLMGYPERWTQCFVGMETR